MNFTQSNIKVQIALALSAASALIYEVVATNVLFFYFIESSYSIATVLGVFLAGLGIGSYLIYKFSDRIKNKIALFSVLQLLIAIYAVMVLANVSDITRNISTFGLFGVSVALLLLPTIFLGAIFPLAGAMFVKKRNDITGLVYSSDLLGAIAGALMAGFVLIPIYGNQTAVYFGAGINVMSALIIKFGKFKSLIMAGLLAMTGFVIFVGYDNSVGILQQKEVKKVESIVAADEVAERSEKRTIESLGDLSFKKNSPFGLIRVIDKNILFINERDQCRYLTYNDRLADIRMTDYALEQFPSKNARTLNIGFGCGNTVRSLLSETSVPIDAVEINPVIVEAGKIFASEVIQQPGVNLMIDEGLNYLRSTDKLYDSVLITLENPAVAHASNLYTIEAYRVIADSLSPDGNLILYNHFDEGRYVDIMYYTLKEVFPYVYIYPEISLASKKKLDQEEYVPTNPYEINTLDKNVLSQAYLEAFFPEDD